MCPAPQCFVGCSPEMRPSNLPVLEVWGVQYSLTAWRRMGTAPSAGKQRSSPTSQQRVKKPGLQLPATPWGGKELVEAPRVSEKVGWWQYSAVHGQSVKNGGDTYFVKCTDTNVESWGWGKWIKDVSNKINIQKPQWNRAI